MNAGWLGKRGGTRHSLHIPHPVQGSTSYSSLCSGFNTTCPSAVRNGKFIEIVRIPRRAHLASSSNSLGYQAVSAGDGVYGAKKTGNPITLGCHVAFMRHSFPQRAISAGDMSMPKHLLVLGMSSGRRNGYSRRYSRHISSSSHLFSAKLFQCILSSSARCILSISFTSSLCTSIPGVYLVNICFHSSSMSSFHTAPAHHGRATHGQSILRTFL